ncbi:hypothetical protein Avbf_00965 [Armadillidium vulgare]|nr:hypothetical protein Avbf_00965 [Armadillidium vulgare]
MSVWRKYKNLEEIELEIRAEIEEFENKHKKELRELEEKHEIMRRMAQLGMKRNYSYDSGKGMCGRKRCRSATSPRGPRRKLYTCPIYLCPGSFDNIERHAKSAHANYSVTNEDLQFFVERTKRIHGLKAQTTAINDLYLPPTKNVLQKEAKKGQEEAKQKTGLNFPSASSNKQRTVHVKGQRKELDDKGRYGMVREIYHRGKEMKRHLNTKEEQVKLTETIDQVDRNGHLKNLIDEFDRHIQRTKTHKYQARGLFRRFLLSFSPIYENFLYDNILRQIDKIENFAKFSKKYKVLGFNSQRKLVTVIKQFLTFCDRHTNLSADLITHSEISHLQQVLHPYNNILKKKEVIERGISQHPKCNTKSFRMEDIVNFSDREAVMNVLRWAAAFETGEIARKFYTLKKTLLLRSVLLTTLTLSTGRRALEGMSLTVGFAMQCIRSWEEEIKEDPEAVLKIPLAAQKTCKPGMTGNYFAHGTFARAFRSYLSYILPIYLDRPVKNTDYVFCSPFGNMIPFKAFNKMLREGWMLAYPSYKGPLLTSRLVREKIESETAVRNPEIISEVKFMKSHPVERYKYHDKTKWLETDLKTYLTLRQKYAWDREMEIEQEEETYREKGTYRKNGEETEEDTDREKEMEEEERRTREKEVQVQCDDESGEGSCGEVESVGEQDYKEYEAREVSLGEVGVVKGKNRVEGKERQGSSVFKERDEKHIDNKEMLRRIYFEYQNNLKKNNTKFCISEFRTKIPKSSTYYKSNRYYLKKLLKQFENE